MNPRATFAILCSILSFSGGDCFGAEPTAFDRLARGNLRLKTTIQSAGSKVEDQTMASYYGYYFKNITTAKAVKLEISMRPPETALTVEAYAVFKDYQSKDLRIEKLKVDKQTDDIYMFLMATEKTRERWSGYSSNYDQITETGEKILAWFARVVSDNQIVATAASSTQYEELAQKPDKLAEFLAKNKPAPTRSSSSMR